MQYFLFLCIESLEYYKVLKKRLLCKDLRICNLLGNQKSWNFMRFAQDVYFESTKKSKTSIKLVTFINNNTWLPWKWVVRIWPFLEYLIWTWNISKYQTLYNRIFLLCCIKYHIQNVISIRHFLSQNVQSNVLFRCDVFTFLGIILRIRHISAIKKKLKLCIFKINKKKWGVFASSYILFWIENTICIWRTEFLCVYVLIFVSQFHESAGTLNQSYFCQSQQL